MPDTAPVAGDVIDDREAPVLRSILVVGTDDWAIEQAGDVLTRAGHRVLRCHEPGQPAFPCNALREGGVCPLDVGFDLTIDIRSRPTTPPGPSEFGVVCGLRRGVPLMIGGLTHGSPFEPWADGVVEPTDDLPTAVRRLPAPDTIDLRTP